MTMAPVSVRADRRRLHCSQMDCGPRLAVAARFCDFGVHAKIRVRRRRFYDATENKQTDEFVATFGSQARYNDSLIAATVSRLIPLNATRHSAVLGRV
jgi:hypothetical protein